MDNLSELNALEKGPVKYIIVLKSFVNIMMAKKYIETLQLKGVSSLKILSESNLHRVYQATAYTPEEANKLKEQAKLIESQEWVMEQPF